MTSLSPEVLPEGAPALDMTFLSIRAAVQVLSGAPCPRGLAVGGAVTYRATLRDPGAGTVLLCLEPVKAGDADAVHRR